MDYQDSNKSLQGFTSQDTLITKNDKFTAGIFHHLMNNLFMNYFHKLYSQIY